MNVPLARLAAGILVLGSLAASASASDEGFTIIFDKSHTDGWEHIGDGQMRVENGVASTSNPPNAGGAGLFWYRNRPFGDFTLKLEIEIDSAKSNSGIFVRFPDPEEHYDAAVQKGYEIDIFGPKTGTIISPTDRARPTMAASFPPSVWNSCEITVIGQEYTVRVNGQMVNEFHGNRALSGYIGLQNYPGEGDVHFRNILVKELPPAEPSASGAPETKKEKLSAVLAEQAPNALEWALAPLDQIIAAGIRENLTLLRESLLDEAVNHPTGTPTAYETGHTLCNTLIATLNERDEARVRAGYRAAQAEANVVVTNQALEARRRFTSWPAYHRENIQREELRREKERGATLEKQRPVVEWAQRAAQIRKVIDAQYAQFREAARQPFLPR